MRLGDEGTPPEIGAARERVVAGIRRIGHGGGKRQGAVARLGETGGARTGADSVDDATGEEGVSGSVEAEFAMGGRAAVADHARGVVLGAIQRSSDERGAIEVEHGTAAEIERRDQVHQAGRRIDLQGALLDIDTRRLGITVDRGIALQEQGARAELGEIVSEDATAHRGGATDVDQAFGRGGRAGRVTRDHRAAGARLERGRAEGEGIAARSRGDRRAQRDSRTGHEHTDDEAGGAAGGQGDRRAARRRGDDAWERDRTARIEEDRSAEGRGTVGEQAARAAGSGERSDAGDTQEGTVARSNVRVGADREGRRAGGHRLAEGEIGDARREDGADRRDRTRHVVRQDAVRSFTPDEVRSAVAGHGDDRRDQDPVGHRRGDGGIRTRHADVGRRDADAVRTVGAEGEAGGDVEDERAVRARRAGHGQRGQGGLAAGEAAEQHVGAALVSEGAVRRAAEGDSRGRRGRELELSCVEVRRARGRRREGVGATGEQQRTLVEAEERVGREGVERERAVAGLAQGVGGRGDVRQRARAREEQGLARGDVDRAGRSGRAIGEDAVSREAVGDAQDARIRAEREAGEAGAKGDGAVGDRIAEVGVGGDADVTAVDREAAEAVVATEDEGAIAGLREHEAREVAGGVLGDRRSRTHRDRGSGVEDREIAGDGDATVERGERAAVEHHMGSGRERRRAVDVEHAGVDLREASVGVRALEVDDAAARLDEVVEAAPGAILNDAGEDHAGVGVVLGERTGGAGRCGVGAAGKADRAVEEEVGVGAAVRVEGGVAEHHDVVREAESLRGANQAEVQVRTERAAVEDELAGAEGARVGGFEDDALVEREVTAEGVLRIQEHPATTVRRGDGLRLDRVAEDADLDGARAHEHGAIEVEVAIAAEAVGITRTDAEAGRGVDGWLIVQA